MSIFVNPLDTSGGKTIFLTGSYEPKESGFIKKFVRSGMTVLDIGANIGAHTLLLANCVGEKGSVHAFEPTVAGELLKRSLQANQTMNVTFNPIALGSTCGSLRLTRCKPGAECFTSIGTPLFAAAADGYMDVPVATLDYYAEKVGLTDIDFAKMDIEGAEVSVLSGAKKVLRDQVVRAWMVEMNYVCLNNCGSSLQELVGLLTDAGYVLFLLDGYGLPISFEIEKVRKDTNAIALLPDVIDQMRQAHGPWEDTFCAALERA